MAEAEWVDLQDEDDVDMDDWDSDDEDEEDDEPLPELDGPTLVGIGVLVAGALVAGGVSRVRTRRIQKRRQNTEASEQRESLGTRHVGSRNTGRVVGLALLYYAATALGIIGPVLLALSFRTTRSETTGHLWWKETHEIAVPTNERVGFLVSGLVALAIAITLLVVARRAPHRGHH